MLYLLGVFITCFKPHLKEEFLRNSVDANDILGLIGLKEVKSDQIKGRNGIIILLASHVSINSEPVKRIVDEFNSQHQNQPNLLERTYFDWRFDAHEYFQTILSAIHTLNLIAK